MMINFKRILGLLFLAQTFCVKTALSCPNCKDFLATESARSLAEGYFWSIIVMLSLPFVLTAIIVFLVFQASRKKTKRFVSEANVVLSQ